VRARVCACVAAETVPGSWFQVTPEALGCRVGVFECSDTREWKINFYVTLCVLGIQNIQQPRPFVHGLSSYVVCEINISVFQVRRLKSVGSAQANHTPNTHTVPYCFTSVSTGTTGTFW